jgi:hypothetical protein
MDASAADATAVCRWLNVAQVAVQPDPVDGWQPVIVAARSSGDKYQQLLTKSRASRDWSTT